jgi:hypothetical protein
MLCSVAAAAALEELLVLSHQAVEVAVDVVRAR